MRRYPPAPLQSLTCPLGLRTWPPLTRDRCLLLQHFEVQNVGGPHADPGLYLAFRPIAATDGTRDRRGYGNSRSFPLGEPPPFNPSGENVSEPKGAHVIQRIQ